MQTVSWSSIEKSVRSRIVYLLTRRLLVINACVQGISSNVTSECAKRWQNSLDPNVDHSKWDDDNEKLLSCVQRLGRNWTAIREKCFPNRTTTDLKNRSVFPET